MKKITLLMTLLMLSFSFYGQTYLDESFEGSFPPAGWFDQAGSGDVANNSWLLSTSGVANPDIDGANFGDQAAFFNDYSGVNDKWLIAPVDLTGAGAPSSPEFTFYEMTQYTTYATVGVYYATDFDGTNAASANWVALHGPGDSSDAQDAWTIRGPYDLSAFKGSTIHIGFRYIGENHSEWYIDDVLVRDTPTCVEPSSGSISSIMPTSASFSWTKGPGGTETTWDVELVDITAGQTHEGTGPATPTVVSTSSNPYSFTSLTPGNSYAAYVRADCGGGDKSNWTGPFTFITGASNDECANAQVIVQEVEIATAAGATAHSGTIINASNSGIDGCSPLSTANDDVWFTFEAVTPGVNITLDTPGFDGVLQLFTSDDCGTFTPSSSGICQDNNGAGATEEIVTTLTEGTTYYVRVYQWEATVPANGNFTIKIWSSESLSTEKAEINEFRLYPNPVSDNLNVKAQNTIENISVYNMLGQEVMRQMPNKMDAKVDMTALQTGTYFVKVTINGTTETKRIIKR